MEKIFGRAWLMVSYVSLIPNKRLLLSYMKKTLSSRDRDMKVHDVGRAATATGCYARRR
jgi:hypothetical protein